MKTFLWNTQSCVVSFEVKISFQLSLVSIQVEPYEIGDI